MTVEFQQEPTSGRNTPRSRRVSRRADPFGFASGVLLTLPLLTVFASIGFEVRVALPLSILLGMTVSRLFSQVLGSREDLFSPVGIIAGYFILNIGLRTVYLSLSPEAKGLGLISYSDFVPTALWLGILAYFSFLAGYFSPLGRFFRNRLPMGKLRWPDSVPTLQITIILLLSLFSMLVLLKKGGGVHGLEVQAIGEQNDGFGLLILLSRTASFAFSALWIFKFNRFEVGSKRALLPLLCLSIATLVVQVAVTGSKRATFEPIMQGLIVFHYLRSRIKMWQLAMIGIPSVVLGFGVVNFYRFGVVGQDKTPTSIAELSDRVSTAAAKLTKGASETRQSAFDQMLNRQTGVDSLAIVSKFTPDPNPPLMGVGILDALISLIPHQLWPGKPFYSPGRHFERYYLGEPSSYDGHIAIHIIPDLYMNFSYFGIPIGMFIIGALLRCFYLLCSPSRSHPSGVFFYAVLLPNLLTYMEGTVETDIVFFIHLALPLAIVGYFFRIRYQPGLRSRNGVPLQAALQRTGVVNPG